MNDNRLVIASAGSGKTTQIVEEALSVSEGNVLITTYTQANEREIKKKIIQKNKSIPSNITIQTWFSFLIQHGVKPYQSLLSNDLYDLDVRGLLLSQGKSGIRYSFRQNGRTIKVPYKESENFLRHYFTKDMKIFSDKLSKFVFKVNRKSRNEVFRRISRLYSSIFIDEVQDLAGYDLELIKNLLKTESEVLLVGDPRQVTYLTHLSTKHKKYREGRIKQFLLDNCSSLIGKNIDEHSLLHSHRNNEMICKYSSQLYPDFPESEACDCCDREATRHDGVFFIRPNDVKKYLETYNPMQLRWSAAENTDKSFPAMNFGESKGLTFDRVLIYPTADMVSWIENLTTKLTGQTRSKFYVGLTRARHSTAIIFEYDPETEYAYANKFSF